MEKLNLIEDVLVNRYGEENEPFNKQELKNILDSICDILDEK